MGDQEVTRPTIYTVGDSHAIHAWLKIPGVSARSVGPMLMHSFNEARAAHIIQDIPEEGIIVFSWGEIDCRCHVKKHEPWKETVDKLAADYIATILEMTKNSGQEVWVYNVLPPPRKGTFIESEGFPLVGTDEERLAYARRMNYRLRKGCEANGLVFVDVFEDYADENGFLRFDMSDGHVHIEDEKPLARWIERRFAK